MHDTAFVFIFLGLLGIERLFEVTLSLRNETWMRSQGGKEHDGAFSRMLFLFHGLWFVSFAVEGYYRNAVLLAPSPLFVMLVLLLQGFRYWCVTSLGKFWNTKIIVLPGASVVRRGPYRRLKHPNYLVVSIEIPLYPILWGCWVTAFLFGFVNLVLLRRRIRREEDSLRSLTDYGSPMT